MCVRHKTVIVTSVLKQPYSVVNIRTHADHIYTGDVSFIRRGAICFDFLVICIKIITMEGTKILKYCICPGTKLAQNFKEKFTDLREK